MSDSVDPLGSLSRGRQSASNVKDIASLFVFISYSQSQDESGMHREWVKRLSCKLKGLGVMPVVDLYNDGSQTISSFIDDGIRNSQYVICVCSSSYVDKTRNTSRRSGVRKEYECMMERNNWQALPEFVIPVLRDSSSADFPQKVPNGFSDICCHNFEDERNSMESFARIVKRILDVEAKINAVVKAQQLDASCYSRALNNFLAMVAQYWKEPLDSNIEAYLGSVIRSGDIKTFIDEPPRGIHQEYNYVIPHSEKILFSIGCWNTAYQGDKEILSMLAGENDNERH